MDTIRPLPRRTLPPLHSSNNENQESSNKNSFEESRRDRPLPKPVSRISQPKPNRNSTNMELSESNNQSMNVVAGEEGVNQTSDLSLTRRSRAKRRQTSETQNTTRRDVDVVGNGHALTEMISEEDIVPVDRIDNERGLSTLPGVTTGAGISQPQNKVYVQTTSGFTSRPTEWVANHQAGANNHDISNLVMITLATKTSDVALSFHRAFMFLCFFLHGLLAGICVWQIVFPFSLSTSDENNFISQYFSLAQPIQVALYILLIFCFLSALDRYNLAKPKQNFFWRLLKFQASAWLMLVYFVAFMITVGMGGIDFWLANVAPFLDNPDVTSTYFNADAAGTVRTWLALNTVRSCFAILGWFIVSIRPNEDNTVDRTCK